MGAAIGVRASQAGFGNIQQRLARAPHENWVPDTLRNKVWRVRSAWVGLYYSLVRTWGTAVAWVDVGLGVNKKEKKRGGGRLAATKVRVEHRRTLQTIGKGKLERDKITY